MQHFVRHRVAVGMRILVTREMPSLAAGIEAEVEWLWRAACARMAQSGAGALFNGPVISAEVIEPHEIRAHVSEYRRVVAQMAEPALFEALALRPLAACGVLCCSDGVAFGRRHPEAVYQPGLWQLPPAGSVDARAIAPDGTIDLLRQIRAEAHEELGLAPDLIEPAELLCMVEHPKSHVCDIGMLVKTRLSGKDILAAHGRYGNAEYNHVVILPFTELGGFVANQAHLIVPPAAMFLREAGLLE